MPAWGDVPAGGAPAKKACWAAAEAALGAAAVAWEMKAAAFVALREACAQPLGTAWGCVWGEVCVCMCLKGRLWAHRLAAISFSEIWTRISERNG